MAKKTPTFEEALRRLEEIVEKLESGELSLEESMALFEEGVSLTRTCGRQLEQAEQKVSTLLAEADVEESAAGVEGEV